MLYHQFKVRQSDARDTAEIMPYAVCFEQKAAIQIEMGHRKGSYSLMLSSALWLRLVHFSISAPKCVILLSIKSQMDCFPDSWIDIYSDWERS